MDILCTPLLLSYFRIEKAGNWASLTVWKSHLSPNPPQDGEQEQEFCQAAHLAPPPPHWQQGSVCPSGQQQIHLLKSPLWGFWPHGDPCGFHGGTFGSHGSLSSSLETTLHFGSLV